MLSNVAADCDKLVSAQVIMQQQELLAEFCHAGFTTATDKMLIISEAVHPVNYLTDSSKYE